MRKIITSEQRLKEEREKLRKFKEEFVGVGKAPFIFLVIVYLQNKSIIKI